MSSDVSALIPMFSHLMMAPLSLGSVAMASLGPLPRHLVVVVVEVTRLGATTTMGAMAASYLVQFITILNMNWINQYTDHHVIGACVACSFIPYAFYVPMLIKVKKHTIL